MLTESLSEPSPAEVVTQPIGISLFGAFRVTINGVAVTRFRSTKVRALLAYLFLTHPQPLLRTTLSELLWPDYANESAQTNLRQTLANVRESFAPFALLQANRQHVYLTVDPTIVSCDVLQFDALLDACQRHDHPSLAHCSVCQARLQQAVALARGALLEHFPKIDSAPFEAWLADQRARFAARLAEAQVALAAAKAPLGNLPPALTPFVGRTADLAELASKLQHPTYRCVSLIGPGGIGKTRLACAVGEQAQEDYPAGVWLVDLSALAPTSVLETPEQLQDRLATAIAMALGCNLEGGNRPAIQVMSYLADKTALLILDNFEHLSAGAAWLPVLLTAAPRLQLLITTRHRLPLQSQLVHQVRGLALPPEEVVRTAAADQLIAHYPCLQLFVERAESAHLLLNYNAATLTTISQLCRLVDGSPWAIELAVSLLDQQSPAAILQALQSNYRALRTPLLDVPARQRSAEAVLRTAWQLLTPSEAQTLARCAVFRNSFTLAAAQTVAAATPALLDALVHKSLLSLTGAEHYAMHELVRQFAAEQLARSSQAQNTISARHATYYIELLRGQEAELYNKVETLKKLQTELDNIRAAWLWCTEQGKLALLEQGAESLQDFYRLAGLYEEALQLLGAALFTVRQAVALSPTASQPQRLLARLLCYIAQFYRLYRRADEVKKGELCAREALALGQRLADPALQGLAYHALARLADAQSDYALMSLWAAQACTQARRANLPHLAAECLNDLGIAVGNCTQPLAGIPHFQEALACLHAQPNRVLEARITGNLAGFYLSGHEYQAAYHHFQQLRNLRRLLQRRENSLLTQITYGDLWVALGAYADARQEYAYGVALVRARHTSYWESWLHASYGRLQHLRGDPAAAQATCRLGYQIAQEDGQRFIEQRALINLGHALADLGELAEAAHCYQQAISTHEAGNWLFRLPDALAGLAAVLLAQNAVQAACAHVETALALLAQQGLAAAGEPFWVYWTCVRVLDATGDARAQAVLATAYQALQERAAQLADAELRHSFLETVAANRLLIAAAHAAGIPQEKIDERKAYRTSR